MLNFSMKTHRKPKKAKKVAFQCKTHRKQTKRKKSICKQNKRNQ